jgi:type II secretory pathway component PulM
MRFTSPVVSKVAAIALAAIALLLMYAVLVAPVTSRLASLDEQIDEQRRLLGRFADLLDTVNPTDEDDEVTLKSLNFVLLAGHNEQIKAASLQARVTKSAEDVGIRLARLAIIPARSEDGVRVVGVDVQFQTNLERLRDLLLNLETQRPMVLVDALQISRAPDASQRPGRELDVMVTALGLVGKADENQ